MAFVVTRRTKELGVRMALGARPSSVLWLVMREVVMLLAIGLAIGIPAAMAWGRLVSAQLFEVKANDPLIGSVTVGLLAAVAAVAGWISALRRQPDRSDSRAALRMGGTEIARLTIEVQLVGELPDGFFDARAVQIPLQANQRHSDDVAMVDPAAKPLAQPEP